MATHPNQFPVTHLQQVDVTGCRLIGALSKELGHDGPKHHALVLGKSLFDNHIYVVELMKNGPQVCTYADFHKRYAPCGEIRIQPNDGQLSNLQVAQRAMAELEQGGQSYDLIANNCEAFVNRAMHGKSISSQVINTTLGVAILVGLAYVLKNSK